MQLQGSQQARGPQLRYETTERTRDSDYLARRATQVVTCQWCTAQCRNTSGLARWTSKCPWATRGRGDQQNNC